MIRRASTLLADLVRIAAALRVIVAYNIGPLLRLALGLPARARYEERIRLTLERLGTTYLKLGQFVAMRFDLFPRPLCNELQKLFEHVPPIPYATVCAVIEEELGAPVSALFSHVDPAPIGSASIAQVHRAEGLDGAQLAIKVQRPGIAARLENEMRALKRVAAAIDGLQLLPGLSLTDITEEFAGFTRRELDFQREGTTACRLRRQRSEAETVPCIHWHLSTRKILTMDFIDGVSLAEAALWRSQGRDRALALRLPGFAIEPTLQNFAMASLHQLFGTGFFHADPHPGNILLMAENRIAFVDFGIFGSVGAQKRELLMTYTESAAIGDLDGAWRAFARLSTPTGRTDMPAYRRATMAQLARWYQQSMAPSAARAHIGELVGQMTDIMRRHHVRIDLETLLFWRAVIALDASALTLSPRFDLAQQIRRYFSATRAKPVRRLVEATCDPQRTAALAGLIVTVPRIKAQPLRIAQSARLVPRVAPQLAIAASMAICAALFAAHTMLAVAWRS